MTYYTQWYIEQKLEELAKAEATIQRVREQLDLMHKNGTIVEQSAAESIYLALDDEQ